MPTAGDKLQVVIPVSPRFGAEGFAYNQAVAALESKCAEDGLTATDITHLSSIPWTEPFNGIGPHVGYTLHTYEATAA